MTGHHKLEFGLLLTSTIFLGVILYFAVTNFGAEGAAVSSLIVYATSNTLRYILVRIKIGLWLGHWSNALAPACAFLLAIVSRFFAEVLGGGLTATLAGCCLYAMLFGLMVFSLYGRSVLQLRNVILS